MAPTALLPRQSLPAWSALLFWLALMPGAAQAALTVGEVAADRQLWPKQIALTKPLTVQVVDKDMEPKGFLNLKKGQFLSVASISSSTVDVRVIGGLSVIFAEDTDLLERAAYRQKHGRDKPTAKPKAKPPASSSRPTSAMGKRLTGKLVQVSRGQVLDVLPRKTKDAKYYAFYHSAKWCPPCRAFTPKLVEFYHRKIKNNPNVELIFISADRNAGAMEDYLRSYRMPWPAIRFNDRKNFGDVASQCGRGIPGLVIYNREGKVVSSGNRDQVLHKLESL